MTAVLSSAARIAAKADQVEFLPIKRRSVRAGRFSVLPP
jgi:hypothetical protein